jgi:tetratricopeptide (TPR) repeat protein
MIMRMNRYYTLGAFAVILVAGALFLYSSRTAPAPQTGQEITAQSTTTTQDAAILIPTTSTTPSAPAAPFILSLVKGDAVVSWNFKGAYAGNAELAQKAQGEISRLSAMLGSGTFTDYSLYVSIANQYDLLGDGAQEFVYLKKALGIDSEHTGLAWSNLGHLLSRLGAKLTARVAFERAVAAQPIPQYEQDLADFLK